MLENYKNQLADNASLILKIKVHAGASQTGFKATLSDGTIKIDVAKTPADGKANEVLIEFLSQEFSVPKSNIEILMGKFSANKIVKVIR